MLYQLSYARAARILACSGPCLSCRRRRSTGSHLPPAAVELSRYPLGVG